MNKYILSAICFLFSNFLIAQNGTDLTQQVPFSKEFRIGVLPNGLTYYLKHNEIPKGKASFYLYQNVGAVLESDKQNGLAHFLEHMAFNGSTHFPGNSMIDWLEKKGVKFGKDINAYTSTNKTVYNISQFPLTNKKDIDSCLLILNDWCNELALTDNEIDSERKVIQEEWRQRYNATYRLNQQLKGVKYNHSIYSKRDALGSMDVVNNFKYKELRNFYHDWYRTDLQAIGIIGDFDVDEVERKVKDLFGKIPAIKKPKERFYITIPDNEEPLYKIATDKEVKDVNFTLEIRHFYKKDNTQAQLRETIVDGFLNILLNQRLKEKIVNSKAAYKSARALYTDFEKNYKVFNLNFTSNEAQVNKALKDFYTELQRVVKYGFTQKEINDVTSLMLKKNQSRANGPLKVSSDGYGKNIRDAYLDGIAIPDNDFNYNFVKTVIPTITKEEVSRLVKKYLTKKNRVYTITAPKKENLKVPSLTQIQDIMTQVEEANLKPYVNEKPIGVSLLDSMPEGGKVVSQKLLKDFKAVEWQLSNGAKVVYKISNYKKSFIELNAVSPGGASLYDIKDIPSLQAVSLASKFGIGNLDPVTYNKVMNGNSAKSTISIENYSERIRASAAIKDMESMFQLVYMRFEKPRFDQAKFKSMMAGNYSSLKSTVQNPNKLIGDTYKTLAANGDPRYFEFNKAYLDQINFNRAKEIYAERFNHAGDFTFYLIGNAPVKTVKSMVEKYIGAISTGRKKESWKPLDDYFPKGFNEHRIEIPMEAPKATVVIKMQKPAKYNRKTIVCHKILGEILNIQFIKNIREKEGGVYTIGVNSGDSRMPKPYLNMDISFNCAPNNAEHINDIVHKELDDVIQNVEQSDLDKVVLNMKKNRPLIKRSNRYWMQTLETYYNYGENMMAPEYFDAILNEVTPKDIQNAAKLFFDNPDTLNIIFVPESK
ncbi:M16 family metallopeptidase [Aestuariibaculum sediminum]|uniref:Insulinase family protein n=1 Tax=Aestuariibaculum sediminum TaxID=2770637 RepID=A0A8J6U6M2_9FLAO|nr:M16 family metallopeptidase [Aestuariibaculum sediminum]MBD0830623.1 insulinase family protein [Aestuariibaculum sediminum]